MNNDFSRVITLLRKERGLSQKSVANALGISQALLSHYEKGIRECGLVFLVKCADYYGVSCDYLLGRSPEMTGKTISYDDIPESDTNGKERLAAGGIMAAFNKKLIINSINVLFSLVSRCQSDSFIKECSSYIMLAVYKMFRITYTANMRNDTLFFTIPEVLSSGAANSAMFTCEANAVAASKGHVVAGGDTVESENAPVITMTTLAEEYATQSSSILNLIKNSEAKINVLRNGV